MYIVHLFAVCGSPERFSERCMCVAVQYEVKLSDGTVVDKSPEEGVEYKLKDGELCLF